MRQRRPAGRVLWLALAASVGLGPAAPAQDVAAVLDSAFAELDRTDGPGCTVGLERDGARTLRAYGMADLEAGLALRPESVLESGSVAKQFTAAALVLLEQQGKLGLDDDIRKHLPEVPDFGRTITIRHLLTHTSGLRDQWGLLAIQGFPPGREVHDFDRILDLVSRQRRLNFPPGEEYLYSNTGYSLAAVIVSRVAGKPFAQFSREALFEPLGMTQTQWRDDYRRIVPGRATAYDRERFAWVQDMPFTNVHGNGGLLTTVADLLTWNAALTSGRMPGGAELVRRLETQGRLNDGSTIGYALGLGVGTQGGVRRVSHGGATAGYRTFLVRWPEQGLSLAILCNAAPVNPGRLASELGARLLGQSRDPAPPAPPVAIAAAELAPLEGTYRDSTTDQTVTFAVRNGGLTVAGGGPAAPLTHLGDLRFWHPQAGDYRFERRADRTRVVQFDDAWRRYEPLSRADTAAVRPADFAGRYRSPELDVAVEIVEDQGRLVLRRRPASRITLRPIYRDGFAGGGQTIRFHRGRDGRVAGFQVFAGRVRALEFERLP